MTTSMEHIFAKDKNPDRRPKADQSAEIADQVRAFEARGGHIEHVPAGATGVAKLKPRRRSRRK